MRKLLILSSVLLLLTVVSAPKAYSQIELFGGYSHLALNGAPSNIGSSSNGWAAPKPSKWTFASSQPPTRIFAPRSSKERFAKTSITG